MWRTIAALCLAIGFAHSASAATLSISADKTTYNIGETITLTVFGDDEGAVAEHVDGLLVYSGALVDNGTQSQTNLGNGWLQGTLGAGDDGIDAYSIAFSQLQWNGGSDSEVLPGTVSVVTLIARAIGVVDVTWDTTPEGQLTFFGLTSAPGTSFTIVPEPATAALLGFSLVALAAMRRPRVRRARG